MKALLPALGTGFLVGQPLGQAEGVGRGGTVVEHTELGGPMSHNPKGPRQGNHLLLGVRCVVVVVISEFWSDQ